MMTKMDDAQLATILASEEKQAVGYRSNTVSVEQETALDYYMGEPFGDEREGHSQVVDRSVAEVIDWMIPDLMRIFVGNDEAVTYEPTGPGGEDLVSAATSDINYRFYKDNDGFQVIHDWIKDGLLQKLGVVKVYWDHTPQKKREVYSGLSMDQILLLMQEENIEIIEHDEPDADDPAGLHDVTILRTIDSGRLVIDNIPPEEFLVGVRTRDLTTSDYHAHVSRKTASELIEMGIDESVVKGLSGWSDSEILDEREQQRFEGEDYTNTNEDSLDPSMKKIWVAEEFVKIDYDGDGVAEFRKVLRANKTILENVEIDETNCVSFCPVKMPHKLIGMSMADKVMDLQRIKSVIWRQMLDNLYLSNNPRKEVSESHTTEDTLDDLLMNVPGGIVRTAAPGGINNIEVPFVASSSFTMLEYVDGQREQRTGITRYNQGLEADTLNKTATGIGMIQDAGQGMTEFIARVFGNSLGQMFRKAYKLVRENGSPVQRRINGKWMPIDPKSWPAEVDVEVNVGLGTGKKDKRLDNRRELLGYQEKALQAGLTTPDKIYNTLDGLVKDMGLGLADEYFLTPEEMMAKAAQGGEKQDPKMLEAQQKLELDQAKMQADLAMKREQMSAEIQLKREEMAMEYKLKREIALIEAHSGADVGVQGGINGDANLGGEFG